MVVIYPLVMVGAPNSGDGEIPRNTAENVCDSLTKSSEKAMPKVMKVIRMRE